MKHLKKQQSKKLFWYNNPRIFEPFTTEHYGRKYFWRYLRANMIMRQGKKLWDMN